MAGVFLYTGTLSFACGIFIASFLLVPYEHVLLGLLLGATFGLLAWYRERPRRFLFLVLCIFFCSIALGTFLMEREERQTVKLAQYVEERVTLKGVIVREPDIRETTQHLYIKEDETGELFLATTDAFVLVEYGDRVSVGGVLKYPELFETDLGRTFNYRGYLRTRGVSLVMSFADVTVMEHGHGNIFIRSLFEVKHTFMRSLERLIKEPYVGLAEGLLLGVKRALGEDLEAVFRRVGIIHIIVLSGYNVMLVAEAIMRLLAYVCKPRTRLVIGIVAIISFALVVGLSATVVRASIMAILVLIAHASGRRYTVLRALMLAGVLMVLAQPSILAFDPGFQLSFMATLGLVIVAPLIERYVRFMPTRFGLREFLIATLATQVMVLPLLLFLIGEFSLVSVIVNVLVLPMVPAAMLLSFIAGVLGLVVPLLGTLVGFFSYLSLAYIIGVANVFAEIPFASVVVPQFSFALMVGMYGVLGFLLYMLHKKVSSIISMPAVSAHTGIDDLRDWTIVTFEEYKKELKSPAEGRSPSAGDFPFR